MLNKKKGWVSAYRSMLDDPQYRDPDVLALWMHLLLKASFEDKTIKHIGQTLHIKRGQFVTGRKSLSASSGVQESKIQRLLKRWQIEQQIEQQTFTKYRLITVTNYDKYQSSEQQNDGKVNTTNNLNNLNKNNSFKKPTVDEVANHFLTKKVTPAIAMQEAKKFIEYYEEVKWTISNGKKKMNNWKSSASGWNNRREDREKNTGHSSESAATRTAAKIKAEFG